MKAIDSKNIWHPLTQHKTHPEVLPIAKAKGALLFDTEGNSYIDGIASWYTCMYGHCNPYIIDRVHTQMQELDQIVFSGFTHLPAVELSEKLLDILPNNQQKIFFSDNGSTATEVGMKMALQYHFNKGGERHTILAFEEAFHGDTFGAMSASGLSVYNGPFEKHFIDIVRIPVPTLETVNTIVKQVQDLHSKHSLAGFIYEPLVQGAAGMKMYEGAALNPILAFCKANDMSKGLFHAHTYTANPLACAAAIAGIDLLLSEEIQKDRARIHQAHLDFKDRLSGNDKVTNIRVKGVIFALDLNTEMERYGTMRDQLFAHFKNKGVFLRPLGNTIYMLPPYVITDEQLEEVYQSILDLV